MQGDGGWLHINRKFFKWSGKSVISTFEAINKVMDLSECGRVIVLAAVLATPITSWYHGVAWLATHTGIQNQYILHTW